MMPPRARALAGGDGESDLRSHLVAVTERLLAEQGLEGLTTRRISEEAGVAHGALYNHFADRDDLILAGLVARASTLGDEFRSACPSSGTGTVKDNLAAFAGAMLTLHRGLLPLLAGLIGRQALLARFVTELHAPGGVGPTGILRALDDYLLAEQRLGRVLAGDTAHLVGVLLFAITQLQAVVLHVRDPGVLSAGDRDLDPFVDFLAASLTGERTT